MANDTLVKYQLDDLLPWISKQSLVFLTCGLMYIFDMLAKSRQVDHFVTNPTEDFAGVQRVAAERSAIFMLSVQDSRNFITYDLHWFLIVHQA